MILQGDRGWYGLELHASSTLAVTGCHQLPLAVTGWLLEPQASWPTDMVPIALFPRLPLPICLQFRVGPRRSL